MITTDPAFQTIHPLPTDLLYRASGLRASVGLTFTPTQNRFDFSDPKLNLCVTLQGPPTEESLSGRLRLGPCPSDKTYFPETPGVTTSYLTLERGS